MYILGIHPGGHDTSATLLRDGKIIIAIEEERLSKKKHSSNFPHISIKECLKYAKINIKDVDVRVRSDLGNILDKELEDIDLRISKQFDQIENDLRDIRNMLTQIETSKVGQKIFKK